VRVGDPATGTHYVVVDGYDGDLGHYRVDSYAIVPSGAPCRDLNYSAECIPGERCDFGVSGLCGPVACSNGLDDDGDGLSDWPDDPGCFAPADITEADDCPGGGCPACGNGLDDDGDGHADADDPDCDYAAVVTESVTCPFESDPMIPITTNALSGTTIGATNDLWIEGNFFCGDAEEDSGAPDVVHWLKLPGRSRVALFDLGSFGARIIAIANDCDSPWICLPEGSPTEVYTEIGAGYLFIVVDGQSGLSGSYSLTLDVTTLPGEPCDPAQIAAGLTRCDELTACIDGICRY
jgi:large repetitive protein